MVGREAAKDIEALRRAAKALTDVAEVEERAFDRSTWVRLILVFFPVPFGVLLFRLHLEAWHYYLAGSCLLVFGFLIVTLDKAALRKRDRARAAADQAQTAHEESLADELNSRRLGQIY